MRRANALWLVGFLALYLAGGLAAEAFGESNVAAFAARVSAALARDPDLRAFGS